MAQRRALLPLLLLPPLLLLLLLCGAAAAQNVTCVPGLAPAPVLLVANTRAYLTVNVSRYTQGVAQRCDVTYVPQLVTSQRAFVRLRPLLFGLATPCATGSCLLVSDVVSGVETLVASWTGVRSAQETLTFFSARALLTLKIESFAVNTSLLVSVRVGPAPFVSSVQPASGPFQGGQRVTLVGVFLRNFEFGPVNAVAFGGVNCSELSVQSDTEATCVTGRGVAAATTVGAVVGTAIGTLSFGSMYLYNSEPSIVQVSPSSIDVRAPFTLTVRGASLGNGSDVVRVTLHSAVLSVLEQSDTSVVVFGSDALAANLSALLAASGVAELAVVLRTSSLQFGDATESGVLLQRGGDSSQLVVAIVVPIVVCLAVFGGLAAFVLLYCRHVRRQRARTLAAAQLVRRLPGRAVCMGGDDVRAVALAMRDLGMNVALKQRRLTRDVIFGTLTAQLGPPFETTGTPGTRPEQLMLLCGYSFTSGGQNYILPMQSSVAATPSNGAGAGEPSARAALRNTTDELVPMSILLGDFRKVVESSECPHSVLFIDCSAPVSAELKHQFPGFRPGFVPFSCPDSIYMLFQGAPSRKKKNRARAAGSASEAEPVPVAGEAGAMAEAAAAAPAPPPVVPSITTLVTRILGGQAVPTSIVVMAQMIHRLLPAKRHFFHEPAAIAIQLSAIAARERAERDAESSQAAAVRGEPARSATGHSDASMSGSTRTGDATSDATRAAGGQARRAGTGTQQDFDEEELPSFALSPGAAGRDARKPRSDAVSEEDVLPSFSIPSRAQAATGGGGDGPPSDFLPSFALGGLAQDGDDPPPPPSSDVALPSFSLTPAGASAMAAAAAGAPAAGKASSAAGAAQAASDSMDIDLPSFSIGSAEGALSRGGSAAEQQQQVDGDEAELPSFRIESDNGHDAQRGEAQTAVHVETVSGERSIAGAAASSALLPPTASGTDRRSAGSDPVPGSVAASSASASASTSLLLDASARSSARSAEPAGRRLGAVELRFEDLQIGAMIGRGAFGDVCRGRVGNRVVAIKSVTASDRNATGELLKEATFLSSIHHPNVIEYVGQCAHKGTVYLVMHLAEHGSLFDALHNDAVVLPMALRLSIAYGISLGMRCLHEHKPTPVMHRDLKTPNVLLDACWTPLVTDFGLSKLSSGSLAETVVGSPAWIAPEIIRGEKYSFACDVYSFGIVLWELFSRRLPFDGRDPVQIMAAKLQGIGPDIALLDAETPPRVIQLIERCLRAEPSARPSFRVIVDELGAVVSSSKPPKT